MLDRYPINSASSIAQAIELITANIDNPTELNALGTAVEDLRLVHESVAASDRATLYRLDTSSDSVNAPYVMASAMAGLRWVAIMGYAVNQMVRQNAGAQTNAYEIVANVNNFSEVNIQNTNAGSSTSSDLIATSSDGTSSTHYLDAGINGAGGGGAPFTGAHEAYVYTTDNILDLSAQGAAPVINFYMGATPTLLASLTGGALATAVWNYAGTLDATNSTTAGVTISGGLAIAKAVNIGTSLTVGGVTSLNAATTINFSSATLVVGNGAGAPSFYIDGAAGNARQFFFRTNGVSRWLYQCNNAAESGSNAGSNFQILARDDTGAAIDTPFQITRAITGGITITRVTNFTNVADSIALSTGSIFTAGGAAVSLTLIHGKGRGAGITSNATVSGTITLSATSTEIQTFTGSTAGTIVQFPAANLRGAGIAVLFTINNQSSVSVTPTRAGSDTFQGGGTTDPVVAGASTRYASDGVSVWLKI